MNRESLLSLVHSEPVRTKFLLEVAGGGALVLSLWSWAGNIVLSEVAFVPLTLALFVAYAATLVLLTGNLVRGADRWQVESAMQARRLMQGSPRPHHVETGDSLPATFDHWYFVLRLEDEIKEARRHGGQVSVVMMQIEAPGGASAAVIEQINFDVANMAASHARTMTMPSAIGSLEYAFLLPGSGRDESRARVAPLLGPLGDYWCEFGIAVYPDDATQAEALVELARKEIEDSLAQKAAA